MNLWPNSIVFSLTALVVAALPARGDEVVGTTITHEGGSVTLQVAATPDAEGVLRAAIRFDNEPGWKTYWRDPGVSGIPPRLDVSWGEQAIPSVIGFPIPAWIDDPYGGYAGYENSISLPVEIDLTVSDMTVSTAKTPLTAWFFAGVCREICIPVMGTFSIATKNGQFETSLDDVMAINDAFAALPEKTGPDSLALTVEPLADGGWSVSAEMNASAAPPLFASVERNGQLIDSLAPAKFVSSDGTTMTWHIPADPELSNRPMDLRLAFGTPPLGIETLVPVEPR